VPRGNELVTALVRSLIDRTIAVAPAIQLAFVTNIRTGELRDLGPLGVSNQAQYYTLREAEQIIRSFQSLGVTVDSYFSEREFLEAAVQWKELEGRHRVVYTAAEGGTGSGRRALIPAVCRLLSTPVLNSGAHASSLARHKLHANAILHSAGVRVPVTWMFKDDEWLRGAKPWSGTRVILKPAFESMSIGVDDSSVQVVDGGIEALVRERHRQYGQPVIVQEFVSGDEVGVPIARVGETYALPVVAFRQANGSLFGERARTFHVENVSHDTSFALYEAPAAQYEALQAQAVKAFDVLEMQGVGRIDFRIDSDGRAWAFDTNESPPPMASTSYAFSMASLGFTVEEMLAMWVGICLVDAGLISGV
jgi:D-alanine-D-alanine ligase